MSHWSRRQVLASAAAPWVVPVSARAGSDHPIRSVRAGDPVPVADNAGDTWVAAWASDGNLYSPSDDTKGFHNACSANVAFNRIEGDDPLKLRGVTVNTMSAYGEAGYKYLDHCTWKSSGCTFIDGALYLVVARHAYGEDSHDGHMRQTATNASIVKSTDFGKTWTPPANENYDAPMFPGRRFATPYFVEYGPEPTDADGADRFVYANSNNGFWDNGDDIVLGRVPRKKTGELNAADWQFLGKGDGARDDSWTSKMALAKPLLSERGRFGMTGAVYLHERRRYLMIGWYYPAGGGKIKDACTRTAWDYYEAPHPWGPWKRIGSQEFSPQGYYSPEICPKFQSADRVYAFTAGNWNNPDVYRLTVVPLDLA